MNRKTTFLSVTKLGRFLIAIGFILSIFISVGYINTIIFFFK